MIKIIKKILILFLIFTNSLVFAALLPETPIGENSNNVVIKEIAGKIYEISGSGKIDKNKFWNATSSIKNDKDYTIKIKDNNVKFSDDSKSFFSGYKTNFDFPNNLDTSNVTNMSSMFYTSKNIPDLSNWDTSKVTDMSYMFSYSEADADLSGWDTANVTNMSNMFANSIMDPDVTNWNVSKVTDMSYMFQNNKNVILKDKTKNWDTSSLTNASAMFYNTQKANPNVSNWNMSKVTNFSYMFGNAPSATPNTSNWNTDSATNMASMFQGAVEADPNVSGWNTSKVTNMSSMFYGAIEADPDVTNWDTSKVTNMNSMFRGTESARLDGNKTKNWDTSSVTDMEYMFYSAKRANPNTKDWDTSKVINMRGMFGNTRDANPDTSNWKTNNVTNMSYMFSNAKSANPDTSKWNTVNVTDMSYMFNGTEKANPNVTDWNTAKVTNMTHMFNASVAATLRNADGTSMTTNWNVSKVTSMHQMFYAAQKADPEIGNWDAKELTDAAHMFAFTKKATLKNSAGFNTPKLIHALAMFNNAEIADPDVTNWKMDNVISMGSMFANTKKANPNVSNWKTSNVTDMSLMFNLAKAATLRNDDGSSMTTNWDVSKVTTMNQMFYGTEKADPEIGNWNATELTNAQNMFGNAKAATLKNSAGFKSPKLINASAMFSNAIKANPDTSTWTMGNVTDMSNMFANAVSANPNVSDWDTKNLVNAPNMFQGAIKATPDIRKWNIAKLTNTYAMFHNHIDGHGVDFSKFREINAPTTHIGILNPDINFIIPATFFKGSNAVRLDQNTNKVSINIVDIRPLYGFKISKIKNGVEKNIKIAPYNASITADYVKNHFKNSTEAFDPDADYRIEKHVTALVSQTAVKVYQEDDITDGQGYLKDKYVKQIIRNYKNMPQGTKYKVPNNLDTSKHTYNFKNPNDPNSIREVLIEVVYPSDLKEERNAKFIIYPNISLIDDPSGNTFADPGRTRIIFNATNKAEIKIPAHKNEADENIAEKKSDSFSVNIYVGNDNDGGTKFSKLYAKMKEIGVSLEVKDSANNKFIYWEDINLDEVIGINGDAPNVRIFNRKEVDKLIAASGTGKNEIILKAVFLSAEINKIKPYIEGVSFRTKVLDITPNPNHIDKIEFDSNGITGITLSKDGVLSGKPLTTWANDDELTKTVEMTVKLTAGKENPQTITKKISFTLYRNQDHDKGDTVSDILEVVDNTFNIGTKNISGALNNTGKHPKSITIDLANLGNTEKNANRIVVKTEAIKLTADKTDLENNALFVLVKNRQGVWSIAGNNSDFTLESTNNKLEVKPKDFDSLHKKVIYAHADNRYNKTTDLGANSNSELYDIYANKPKLEHDNELVEKDGAKGIDRKVKILAPDKDSTSYIPGSKLDNDFVKLIVKIGTDKIVFIKDKAKEFSSNGGWTLDNNSNSYSEYSIEKKQNGELRLVLPTDESKFEKLDGKNMTVQFEDNKSNLSEVSDILVLKTISDAKKDRTSNPTILNELTSKTILNTPINVFKIVDEKIKGLNTLNYNRKLSFKTIENDLRVQDSVSGEVTYKNINSEKTELISITYPDGSSNIVTVKIKVYKPIYLEPKIEVIEGKTQADLIEAKSGQNKITTIKYRVVPNITKDNKLGEYELIQNGEPIYFKGIEGQNKIIIDSKLNGINSNLNSNPKTIDTTVGKQDNTWWGSTFEKKEVNIDIKVSTTYENSTVIKTNKESIKFNLLRDTDGDGDPDITDTDDDNDGIPDTKENESGNNSKDPNNFKKSDKYPLNISDSEFLKRVSITKNYGEQVNAEDVKELIIKENLLKNNPNPNEWEVIFSPNGLNFPKTKSKEIGEFPIDILIRFDDDSHIATKFNLKVKDDVAPKIILDPKDFNREIDGLKAITLTEGIKYNKVLVQSTDNSGILIENNIIQFKVEGNLPNGISLSEPMNIPNGYSYNIEGIPKINDWGNDTRKTYHLKVTTKDIANNEVTQDIVIVLNKNQFATKPVYLNVGDETPSAYDYVLDAKSSIESGTVKGKDSFKWNKGVIDTSKEGVFKYTIVVSLASGDLLELETDVYVYDTKKVKDILDKFNYDDTEIVNRFDEKYFVKFHLGPIIPILEKVLTEGKFELEKLVSGAEIGIGFTPIKNNKDFKLITFLEYNNRLVNHITLGLGVKNNNFKGFARYRASLLAKNKANNENLIFMNHVDLYANFYKEFKVKEKFYFTTSLGAYLSAGGGKATKDFYGYDIITKLDTDVKIEYRNKGLSLYATPKIMAGYKQYIYNYIRTSKTIIEKPDGYFKYEFKLGMDKVFNNNIKLGASAKYIGELTFTDKKYNNVLDFEIHTSYAW
ncbi:BspA family leucine-rich repeat surface protein [Oceanivirga salmonicida]|uniref:BspA family leucine-rich repeat surface protein n=1 Tax=Oceanivirga salmonicida TaxID=1769291 RepID=UPI0012E0EFE2|nr:BspA family leucine-rich repeat surface protein [Oceanivirga salmonicida]